LIEFAEFFSFPVFKKKMLRRAVEKRGVLCKVWFEGKRVAQHRMDAILSQRKYKSVARVLLDGCRPFLGGIFEWACRF
jgi:hypothetical protein